MCKLCVELEEEKWNLAAALIANRNTFIRFIGDYL